MLAAVFALSTFFAAFQDSDPARPLVLKGAKVYPVTSAPLDRATIVIQGGKISDVGKDAKIPAGARIVDLAGKVVVPGFIDAGSFLFIDRAEPRTTGSAELLASDALDPFRKEPREALRYGITTACVLPNSSGPVRGQAVIARLGGRQSRIRRASVVLSLGHGASEVSEPASRFAVYQGLRTTLESAKRYRESWNKYRIESAEYRKKADAAKSPQEKRKLTRPSKPARNDSMEILARALDPKTPLPVWIEAHQVDAIERAVKLIEDFKLRGVLLFATEAYRIADRIARAKIPVLVGPVFVYGGAKVDYLRHSPGCAAALVRAGVRVGLGTFDTPDAGYEEGGASRFLLEAASLAARWGLRPEEALGLITVEAAKIVGIQDRAGSLTKGKDADLVVLSGEPFRTGTRVERVMVGGIWRK